MPKHIILPFAGKMNENNCYSVKLNYGLHTQCTNKKYKNTNFCKVCNKNIEKTENKLPPFGDIRDRIKVNIMEYVDPKGNKTTPYFKLLKRLNTTREEVEKEAIKQGIEICPLHWNETNTPEKQRGRPKKETIIIDENNTMEKDKIICNKFIFDNMTYLKTNDNLIFDIDTENCIGEYDEQLNVIHFKEKHVNIL